MPYAQITDMLAWCGEEDLVRLSTPRNAELGAVVAATVLNALNNSTAVIDGYLRKRYSVPLGVAAQAGLPAPIIPPEIVRCCCILATHELAGRDGRNRGEQITADHKMQMAWLRDVAEGRVELDTTEAPSGSDSYAQMQTRGQVFGDGIYGGTCESDDAGFGYGAYP
jgi:phage gp36-like protein